MLSQELMETIVLERLLEAEQMRRLHEALRERPRAREHERPDHSGLRVPWLGVLKRA